MIARRNLLLGLTLSLTFTAAALLSFIWIPYEIDSVNIAERMKTPTLAHPL